MARRRSRTAFAAGRPCEHAQRRLAPPGRLRRAGHARSVGVPVVRGLGPRLPRGVVGAHRSGIREVPAPRAPARVVPPPERRPAGLRVELRRREPAGPCRRRGTRLRDRRRDRLGLPGARLPEAAPELHLVAQPPRPGRQQHLRRRVPRAGQHQPHRPLVAAPRREPRPGRRDRLDGVLRPQHAGDRPPPRRAQRRSTRTWSSSSPSST